MESIPAGILVTTVGACLTLIELLPRLHERLERYRETMDKNASTKEEILEIERRELDSPPITKVVSFQLKQLRPALEAWHRVKELGKRIERVERFVTILLIAYAVCLVTFMAGTQLDVDWISRFTTNASAIGLVALAVLALQVVFLLRDLRGS